MKTQPRGPTARSLFGTIAGITLAVALVLPFFIWGNPYPPQLYTYWALGTVTAAILGAALFVWYDDTIGPASNVVARLSSSQFTLLVAAFTTVASGFLAVYSFRRFATTSDEIAQLWHARILLTGRLSLPVDANPEFFSLDTVVDSGRWYSQFPIGGPLILALGALVGTPWIVNPILAGAAAAAVYQFARRAYDDAQARWMTGIFCTGPMMLLMAGTWMNHVPVMLLATTALLALAIWQQSEHSRARHIAAGSIGFSVGMIAMIRPLDAIVVAAVIGAFQVWSLRRDPHRLPTLGIQTVAGACCVSFLLFANWKTTGAATRFGYVVAWGPGHGVGFHADPYGNSHTLFAGLDYVLSYLGELNVYLTTWPVPALIVLVATFFVMTRPSSWDVLLVAFAATQTLAYGAYWYRGELLGPRFLFTAVPAFAILVARAPAFFTERFGERGRRGAVAAIVACTLIAWVAPTRAVGARGIAAQPRDQRRSLKADIAGAVRNAQLHHALVFMREPFSLRLGRRLWALGIPRGETPQLVESHDACALLTAIRAAERDSSLSLARKTGMIRAVPPVVNPQGSVATDPSIHVASVASLTPECKAEIDGDSGRAPMPFGSALVLEPIDSAGRVNGDVMFVADLGDHNEVLRSRFGDRAWYRARFVGGVSGVGVVLDRY